MRKNISSRKKCVSLWSGTRRISRPPRPVSVQPHLNSTGHCRTLSYSPSTTSLASCPPASIISFLIRSSYPRRSLSARSHSSRPATAQVPLLTLFHRHRQRGEEIVSARQPFTRGMVLCSSCRVNNIDRHCTNTPRACYQCCTSHPTIHTCPPHYQQMGISDAAARLASGLVHPNVVEDAGEGLPRTDSNPQNGGPSSGAELQSSNDSSAQLNPNHRSSGSASGASAAAGAPLDSAAASASSLAALRAGMEADKAATQVQLAALQAQLTAQEASTQRLMALLEARLPTLPQTTSPPAPTSSSAPGHRGLAPTSTVCTGQIGSQHDFTRRGHRASQQVRRAHQ